MHKPFDNVIDLAEKRAEKNMQASESDESDECFVFRQWEYDRYECPVPIISGSYPIAVMTGPLSGLAMTREDARKLAADLLEAVDAPDPPEGA